MVQSNVQVMNLKRKSQTVFGLFAWPYHIWCIGTIVGLYQGRWDVRIANSEYSDQTVFSLIRVCTISLDLTVRKQKKTSDCDGKRQCTVKKFPSQNDLQFLVSTFSLLVHY